MAASERDRLVHAAAWQVQYLHRFHQQKARDQRGTHTKQAQGRKGRHDRPAVFLAPVLGKGISQFPS